VSFGFKVQGSKFKVRTPKLQTKNRTSKIKIGFVCLFAAFAVFACSSGKAKQGVVIANDKSYEASIFRQNCAICHGTEAEGKQIDGKFIPSLRRSAVAAKSEQEIYNQIYHGGSGMLPFKGQLSDNEIRRMAKYIKENLQDGN
jgi:cytochrome c553